MSGVSEHGSRRIRREPTSDETEHHIGIATNAAGVDESLRRLPPKTLSDHGPEEWVDIAVGQWFPPDTTKSGATKSK